MIPDYRFDEYKNRLMEAKDLAAIHGCKYYVVDVNGVGYQCTPQPDAASRIVGEAYPGGLVKATGLHPRNPKEKENGNP